MHNEGREKQTEENRFAKVAGELGLGCSRGQQGAGACRWCSRRQACAVWQSVQVGA